MNFTELHIFLEVRQTAQGQTQLGGEDVVKDGRLRATGGGVGMMIVFRCKEEERKVEEVQ